MKTHRMLWRAAAPLLALALISASCGGDDSSDAAETSAPTITVGDTTIPDNAADDTTAPTESTTADTEPTAPSSAAPAEGEIELSAGVTVNLDDCPSDWSDTTGVSDDEIRLGMTLPQSGPIASLGAIGDGMRAYLDHVNETDPIDGKKITLVLSDDGYDPAKTQTAVTEMLETEDIFAFVSGIGSANALQVRPMLNTECVPQVETASGVSYFYAPTAFPWTHSGVISSATEGAIWCQYIPEEYGEGATVAGLFANNDTGRGFQAAVEACAETGAIDLVENVTYEPTASDISNEITTLAASNADVLVGGVLGAFCAQTLAGVAQSAWHPAVLLTQNCESIPAYFTPTDPAGEGVRLTSVYRTYTDEEAAGNPDLAEIGTILTDAGYTTNSTYMNGVVFGLEIEHALRTALDQYGGITRTNLMKAFWNFDFVNPIKRDGIEAHTDGANDANMVEGAYVVEYHAPTAEGAAGTFEVVSDLVSVEGESEIDEDGETGAP